MVCKRVDHFLCEKIGGNFMTQTHNENLKKWIIYMYTFPNGKRYIGKTHRELHERQGSSNFIDYKNNPLLWKAVEKYGVDNVKQDILVENLNYVIRGISNKNIIPILNCIKFELTNEVVKNLKINKPDDVNVFTTVKVSTTL